MTREEFIKQRCEIDKITEEEFEEQYRVVKCDCGQLYCKGYRCLDLDDLLKENKKLKDNWNKLRDCIETDNKRAKGYIERIITSDLCHGDYPVEYFYAEKRKEITDYYLDKMNELEGKDK